MNNITAIENILTYISCIALSGKLPNLEQEAIFSFLKGKPFSFPDGSQIQYHENTTKLIKSVSTELKKYWILNEDLVKDIDHLVFKERKKFFIGLTAPLDDLAFVAAIPLADASVGRP